MAHGIHGNGGGGKVSSGSSSSSSGGGKSSSGGGRKYNSPIPKLNYSTTDKSSARGRGNESYLRQDIADQKANGGSVNDRNFLAETVEASNGERRSNNEYQQQKEQTRFLDEAQGGREAAEKKAQSKPETNEKDQHAENYRSYLNEADRLTVEKTNSEGLTTEEQDEYDRQIQEAKDKAEEERKAAGIKNTKDKWDELRSAPLLSDDEQEAWAFLQPNEDVENQVGGWGRQYAAGPAMAVGTALEWFDKTSDDMVRYEYDQEHGEGAYDAAIAGKNVNQVGQLGDKIWDTGVGLKESGQQMWEAGTEDMSDLGKEIATVGKAGADLAADAALNFVMPGLGTMRMYAGAMGDASYEQSQRENNDIDSRMLSMVKAGASAYLSNKLVGDVIYGKGIIPKGIDKMLANVSPEVQKVVRPLLNSEGVQEGVENIMNWGADIILGLDTGKPLDWNEVKQDAFIGYVLGVITNGLAGGMNIDSKKQQAIAREGIEFAESGLTVDEAAEIGKQNTRDQVVIKSKPESETSSPAAKPAQDSTGTAWTGDWDSWVNAALSGGALTDTDINTIYNRPEARRAFEELKNISLDGMSEEDAKSYIGMAAGTVPPQNTTVETEQRASGLSDEEQSIIDEIDRVAAERNELQEWNDHIFRPGSGERFVDRTTGKEVSVDEVRDKAARLKELNDRFDELMEIAPSPERVQQAQTVQETNANEMPLGAEPAQEANDTAGEIPNPEQANTNENAGQNQQQSRPLNEEPPEQRREKISQYFSNTLTESGRAEGLDPITYNPTSEAESLTNAAMRLKEDYLGALDNLMKSPAWDGEMVDSAWMIENELFKQWEKTGDRYALDAWKRIETHKISQTAKGLQAVAKQSRPGAAAVLNSIMNEISDVRKANAEAKKAGKTSQVVSEEVLTKAEEKANDIAKRMAHLENMIDDAIASGVSEADAKNAVKNEYLDMIDEINAFRHTGLIQDAKANAEIRNDVKDVNTKFRKWLAEEDMDYIMRFAACDAAGISEDIHYKGKQDFLKRLNTFQKLAQLTGTGTWSRNLVGNASFGLVDVLSAKNPMTWIADMAVSKKTGQRSSGGREKVLGKEGRAAAARALRRSILEVASNIDLATDSGQTKYDMGRTRTYNPDANNIFTRLGSRWEQWNGYMLQSSDAWFKGMAEGSAEQAIRKANKWGDDNLTDAERSGMPKDEAKKLSEKRQADLDETKKQIAEYRTFQNDGIAADAANKMRDAFNKFGAKTAGVVGIGDGNWKQGQFGLGTALMPYTKVPTNLGVKSLEFSPAGMVKGMAEIAKVMNDPKATMAQQNKAVTDFGRGATGTAVIAVLAALMKSVPWFKDWNNEENLDVRAQNKAEGKSGIQVNWSLLNRRLHGDKDSEWRNGDRLVDISSMEPVNQLFTTASLIAEQDELSAKGVADAFLSSTHDNLSGLPSLQTLSNIENTWKYADDTNGLGGKLAETTGSTVGSIAGGFIPAPIKHATTVFDPLVRDTSGNDNVERAVNQAKSGLPGLRQTLPAKRDAFGNVMTSGDVGTRIANQYSPFKHSQVNQGDVSRELEKVREATDEVLVPSRNPVKKVKYEDGTLTFSNKDAKDYQALVGKEQELRLRDLFATDLYKNSTPALKAQMIQEVEKFAKDTGKTALAEAFDINYDSDYKDVRNLKDPVSFLMTKTGYNAVTKAEKWDSVDALLQTVRQGKLSDSELDFYEEHIPGFKKMYSMAGSGIGSQRVTDFANALKAQYEKEKRTDARGSDFIRVAGSGKFSDKEADAFMDYAPDISPKTIDRYREQVKYQLGSASMGGSQKDVWSRIEQVVNGQMTKDQFKSWIDKESGIPKKQREEIKDICTNYAKDRHEAGKTVSSIYKSVRDAGYSPKKALEFYDTIDKDFNGSMSKKEYKAALRKVFGSKEGERIWNNMRKRGVQYVTGRF